MQSARAEYCPVQQYCAPPSLAQADSQATTAVPDVTASALGQFTALVHPAATHPFELILSTVPPDDLAMLIHIGRLDPSTMETS